MSEIAQLKPEIIWKHFQTLCDIPHPSCHEEALRNHLKSWADERGLTTLVDEVGNLIIRKPATPGYEDRAGVVLQGHIDMVPQKNADTDHDFLTDPIKAYVDGDWVTAAGTTLGADNGIGVAAGLAVLEATDIEHGPIEVLLTIDEESGMTGAEGLSTEILEGSILLNLDTEEWGEFYVGCAGGVDIAVRHNYQPEAIPAGMVTRQLALRGLKGGHSGCDIHRERGSANMLMVRVLKALQSDLDLRLVSFSGGTLRNAIAREAFVTVALPEAQLEQLAQILDQQQSLFQAELMGVEENLSITLDEGAGDQVMPLLDQQRLLDALHAAPHGVHRMSQQIEGVVETSNNLAVIRVEQGEISVDLMTRSLLDDACRDHAERISGLFRLIGASAELLAPYPGWTPNPKSDILKAMQATYKRVFGSEAGIQVIHAGLECGILGSKYPEMDMISFGPTITGAHSPDERVEISSVAQFWELLKAVLKDTPVK